MDLRDISLQVCSDSHECFILSDLVVLRVGFCGTEIKEKTPNGVYLNLEAPFAVTLCVYYDIPV